MYVAQQIKNRNRISFLSQISTGSLYLRHPSPYGLQFQNPWVRKILFPFKKNDDDVSFYELKFILTVSEFSPSNASSASLINGIRRELNQTYI